MELYQSDHEAEKYISFFHSEVLFDERSRGKYTKSWALAVFTKLIEALSLGGENQECIKNQ